MIILYIILLFVITFIGASIPLWFHKWSDNNTSILLAFSGTFLLCITLLHIIPENIHHHSYYAPLLITLGFILQLLLQRLTHGLEHGHIHHSGNEQSALKFSFLLGICIHAFSEGIPLGIVYLEDATLSSVFVAVALHKIPEAMLLTSMMLQLGTKRTKIWLMLMCFSLISPLAVLITQWAEERIAVMNQVLGWIVPLVAGSFLQISTTVLYESGTKHHEIKWNKWMAILSGFILALLGFYFTASHSH